MTNFLPKIDQRSQEDLANEIRRLIIYHCPELVNLKETPSDEQLYSLSDQIKSDKQIDGLVNIFSVMMGHVLNALNEAPDKNLTAFLNLIGVSPTAPKVSKAPVVFKLKKDWTKDGFIPSGTKISAQPENKEEVIFETESDLTVIRPGLIKAASINPKIDCWTNQDFLFSEEPTGQEAVIFQGKNQIKHRIYIGHDKLLSYKDSTINLNMNLKEIGDKNLNIQWYYFDEKGDSKPLKIAKDSKSANIMENKGVSFSNVSGIAPKKISGYDKNNEFQSWTKNWIYGELTRYWMDGEFKSVLTNEKLMPEIEDIKLSVTVNSSILSPEMALYNLSPLDITKDFSPFGTRPAFNDTFFIASKEAFSKKDASVKLDVKLSDIGSFKHPNTTQISLAYEYWDGKMWSLLGCTSKPSDPLKRGNITLDKTEAFTNDGVIEFICPDIKPYEINGQENYWIRIRIIGGNYGEDSKIKYGTMPVTIDKESVPITKVEYVDQTYMPPSIKTISISYTYVSNPDTPQMVITENNCIFRDRTNECKTKNKSFRLFAACEDTDPAFYLAFDQDISNLPLSLFFPLKGDQVGKDPVVAWEYWGGKKWLTLSVNDAVRDFTRREIQQIIIPSDIEKRALFGSVNYWIRARLEPKEDPKAESYEVYPTISTIYSNVVWVGNSNTITGEILGSSNGEPSQTFQFSRTPVLQEQVVKVQETLGKDVWTLWEEVQTFSLSNTDSRHYMLDAQSGTLVFGDGKKGMVPPAGKDNIKCDYKYGGGVAGNVSAGTITKLFDNFPEIDSAYNPIASDGGFDQEDTEDAITRGPHTLKSRNRGVTCEDIEWLVREAAPQIAIVKCFPTMDRDLNFAIEKATVVVVPEYKDPKPAPSQELLNEIDEFLSNKISTILNTAKIPRLDIIGPDYIRAGINASVVYTTPESGKIIEGRIIENLKTFLDPLKGGQDKTGWKLGKNLYISEICSVIKNTAGVDYIKDIKVYSSIQCYTLGLELKKNEFYKPSVNYPKYSAVKSSDNRIVFGLAQKLKANKGVKTLLVKGFKEGDDVILRYKNITSQTLRVVSVEGDILECKTCDGSALTQDYPVGTDIQDFVGKNNLGTGILDLIKRSYILNDITGNPSSFFIKIAVPEARDVFYLSRNDEYTNTTPLKIHEIKAEDIFLEEDELIYSGIHLINKNETLKFPYLENLETGVIHDLSYITENCRLYEIVKEDRKYRNKITTADTNYKCSYCFHND